MSKHPIKLSQQQKIDWFEARIKERLQVKQFESEQEIVDFVRSIRASFKTLYERDVPGSFISQLLTKHGVKREHSKGVKKKRTFMFELMDKNANFRENKTQCRKAVEAEFGETILNMVFDDLWDEYHNRDDLPEPTENIDIHGRQPLF